VETFFEQYEKLILKYVHLLLILIDAFCYAYQKTFNELVNTINRFFNLYKIFMFEFYGLFRWTTFYFNWIIIRTWLWYVFRPFDSKPYLMNVLKYWKGDPGAGKSLISYVISEEIREEFGMASYFTSPIEKPRLSEDESYYYVYHRVINLSDYYKNRKKVLNFNTDRYACLWKDENNLRQNPRFNKEGLYNDEFKPEHDDEVLLRHLGFKHGMNVISQQAKTDSQRMETTAFYFDVRKTIKGVNFSKWLHDGKFEIIPIAIKVDIYTITVGFGEMKRHLYRKMKKRVPYQLLEHYNTHAESNRFAHLKKDYN
jgi:hypothetical protein